MTPKLTQEMRQALDAAAGRPIAIQDDQSHDQYVLLPMSTYERIVRIFRDADGDVTGTYAAQSAVAAATGWDDHAETSRNPS